MPGGDFFRACDLLEEALRPESRAAMLERAAAASTLGQALSRLLPSMRSHVWSSADGEIDLRKTIAALDNRTRQDGFHALNDWDGKALRVNDDIIPVDVLAYIARKRGAEPVDRATLAILLDYYFIHLLSLLTLRLWDDGDPDENLDRVNTLLGIVQSGGGSGQKFVDDAETLMLIATSHYEPDESGFERLLHRVGGLSARHRARIAVGHASSMGCHLRFGFEAQCGRDMVALREDNVADYPWLCFALANVMEEYVRLRQDAAASSEQDAIVEALLNGLTPDARAFVAEPAASLARSEDDLQKFGQLFWPLREELLDRFEQLRPAGPAYSPLALYFNFSHNVLKGTVIDALVWGEPGALGLNDLLRGSNDGSAAKLKLATTLMGYARSSPDRIRGRLTPVIVYDPPLGRQAFSITMRKLRAA
jgi:hypothetical protein